MVNFEVELGMMEKYVDRFYQEIGENLKRLGVKVLLFDLDDTLILK